MPADPRGGGFDHFLVRVDLAPSLQHVYDDVKAAGGVLTSSGGLRDLTAPVGPGRSPASLHYLGRAIDLGLRTGMQSPADPYLVVRRGAGSRPGWRIYCPVRPAPVRRLRPVLWRRGIRSLAVRPVPAICLTDILTGRGWRPIRARAGWRDAYLGVEWWHFENTRGLVAGRTTFGAELRRVWPAAALRHASLPQSAVWDGAAFRV